MLLHAKGMHPLRIQLLRVLHHALIPVVTILARIRTSVTGPSQSRGFVRAACVAQRRV
jgi:ABC-type dipeptide/oligopeptide/nickel transport system permease component